MASIVEHIRMVLSTLRKSSSKILCTKFTMLTLPFILSGTWWLIFVLLVDSLSLIWRCQSHALWETPSWGLKLCPSGWFILFLGSQVGHLTQTHLMNVQQLPDYMMGPERSTWYAFPRLLQGQIYLPVKLAKLFRCVLGHASDHFAITESLWKIKSVRKKQSEKWERQDPKYSFITMILSWTTLWSKLMYLPFISISQF